MDYLKVVRTLLLTVVMRIEQIPYSRAAPSARTIALAILSEEEVARSQCCETYTDCNLANSSLEPGPIQEWGLVRG